MVAEEPGPIRQDCSLAITHPRKERRLWALITGLRESTSRFGNGEAFDHDLPGTSLMCSLRPTILARLRPHDPTLTLARSLRPCW